MSDFRKVNDYLSVSPQIGFDDIDAAAENGFVLIINNRPDGEAPDQPTNAELAAYAAEKGLAWAHIPIDNGPLAFEPVGQFAELWFEGPAPVLAFCGSGTRSCTIWALAQNLSDELSVEEIVAQAAGAGYDLGYLAETLTDLRQG